MERIFDDYTIHADGTYTGGLIKKLLFKDKSSVLGENFRVTNNQALTYCINFSIKAVSEWHDYAKPVEDGADLAPADTGLPSLGDPPPEKDYNDLHLRDHRQLVEVWQRALDRQVWPLDDKAIDRLPQAQASIHASGSSGGKRSNDDGYDEESMPKKKKAKSRDSKSGKSGGSSSLWRSQTTDAT
jgi:hypothetical protein